MSLILEALKKSEAERSRAREEPARAPEPGRRTSRWLGLSLVILFLGIALVGVYFWLQARSDPGDLVAAEPTAPALPEAQEAAAQPQPGTEQQTRAQPQQHGEAIEPTARPEPMAAAEPAAESPTVTPPPARESRVDGEPTPVESTPPEAPVTVEAPVRERQAVGRRPVASTASPPPSQYPPIETMPDVEARELIRKMKVNVHVYAEDPERRFVLVDLQRRGEGADLADGIRIAEIIPEGVILDVGGDLYLWRSR